MYEVYFALLAVSVFSRSMCQHCPAIYLRYSRDHSYCKPRNPTCAIVQSGVPDAEKRRIVDVHNQFRNLVATGQERRAGGMPTAADMLQMVWDEELASVAQKRAEQCIYAHDCSDCRRVENFGVGQNIAYIDRPCSGSCNSAPAWAHIIKMFYDEVSVFNTKFISSMQFIPGRVYGHFTQMVWSKTWRIGCGYVAFRKGNGYIRQLYVCNYGPSGNVGRAPMYRIGKPCRACPGNSCCGASCGGYEGLCRMKSNNEPPIYRLREAQHIFYCDFSSLGGDCSSSVQGVNRWTFLKTLGGYFADVVQKSGESSTLTFHNKIRPGRSFCLVFVYRMGATVDGQRSSNSVVARLEMPNFRPVSMNLPNAKQFMTYRLNLGWKEDTQVSLTFSVPNGAPDQFFNIQTVSAKAGRC